jgi:hypothetical protein
LMMSHYFIALGSLPQRLPQQQAAGTKKPLNKSMLLGPISPPAPVQSWEAAVPRRPLFRLTVGRRGYAQQFSTNPEIPSNAQIILREAPEPWDTPADLPLRGPLWRSDWSLS